MIKRVLWLALLAAACTVDVDLGSPSPDASAPSPDAWQPVPDAAPPDPDAGVVPDASL